MLFSKHIVYSVQRIFHAKLIVEPIIQKGLTGPHIVLDLYQTLCRTVDALDGVETSPTEATPGEQSYQRRERKSKRRNE